MRTKPKKTNDLLTLAEAMNELRIKSRTTMYKIMKGGQLTFTRVHGRPHFRKQWLDDYLDKRTVKARY
jgi:hypothetical protein